MKTRNKLMVSVFALIATIILATSTTFAWFTMNDKVSVGDIDVSATTGTDGLYIAMGDKTDGTWKPSADGFKVSIDKTAFEKGIKTGFTAVDNKTFGEGIGMKTVTYFAAADTSANLSTTGTVTEPGFYSYDNIAKKYTKVAAPNTIVKTDARYEYEYLEFSLFFRSTVAMNISLLDNSTITSTSSNTTSDIAVFNKFVFDTFKATTDHTVGSTVVMEPSNAARVGFGSGAEMKVWNPNADKGYKVFNKTSIAAVTSGDATAQHPAIEANTTLTCLYIDYILGNTVPTIVPTTFNATTGTCSTKAVTAIANQTAVAEANALCKTVPSATTELKVSMWIEGWDGDCSNSLFSEVFKTVLNFVGAKATV